MGRRINTRVVSDIESGRILSRRAFDYVGPLAKAMGVRFPSQFTQTFIGPLPATNAETLFMTTPPLNTPLDNAAILLLWFACVNPGTSVTSHVWRIRRGTALTGAVIGLFQWTDTVIAASGHISSGFYFDTPGVVAGQQYSLTLAQTAATAAGTPLDQAMLAFVL